MRRNADSRKTQRDRILALLIQARGGWVPLPEILALGVAQYNARVFELRQRGYNIENRKERIDGQLHSYFRLVSAARGDQSLTPETSPEADNRESIQGESDKEAPLALFDTTPRLRYPD